MLPGRRALTCPPDACLAGCRRNAEAREFRPAFLYGERTDCAFAGEERRKAKSERRTPPRTEPRKKR
jgi:hypothetical protein